MQKGVQQSNKNIGPIKKERLSMDQFQHFQQQQQQHQINNEMFNNHQLVHPSQLHHNHHQQQLQQQQYPRSAFELGASMINANIMNNSSSNNGNNFFDLSFSPAANGMNSLDKMN